MKKKLLLVIPLAGTVMALAVGGGILSNVLGADEISEGANDKLEATYEINETVKIPTYTFKIDGQEIPTKGVTIFPNKTTSYESEIVTNQFGIYTINYSLNFGGKTYSHNEKFEVIQDLIMVNNYEKSKISYEIPEFAKKYGVTYEDGVYVSLAKGDALTIAEPIDVSHLNTSVPLINAFVTPLVAQNYDFEILNFRLYDYEDASIYLDLNTRSPFNYNNLWRCLTYNKVAGQNQTLSGRNTSKGTVERDKYGTTARFPFGAEDAVGNPPTYKVVSPDLAKYNISWRFDSSSLECGVFQGLDNNFYLVADLNDTYYFAKPWNGFPSGKARLEITADNYVSSSANFCLSSVFGIDLKQKKTTYKNEPIFNIETDYEVMPLGKKFISYPIPHASVKDVYGNNLEVTTKVFYNKNSDKPVSINVSNSSFNPPYDGLYTIVYSVTDNHGYEFTKEYDVFVGAKIDPIEAKIPSSIINETKVGKIIEVPDLTEITGGTGNYDVKATFEIGDEVYETSNNKFQPLKVGNWTLKYTITDYIGEKCVVQKPITITSNSEPEFAEFGKLAESYMSGCSYDTPVAFGYTFENDICKKVQCDVNLTDGTGTHKITDSKFTPKVENNAELIHFSYSINGKELEESSAFCIIPYVDGKLRTSNYFYGENFTSETTSEGVLINTTAKNSKLNFYNKLVGRKFEIGFKNYETYTTYKSISVKVTDVNDPNHSITATIDRSSGITMLKLGDFSNPISYSATSESELTLGINNSEFNCFGTKVDLTTFDNGDKFAPFYDFVTLSIEVNGTSSFFITKLNNTNFKGGAIKDRYPIDFAFDGNTGGEFGVNSIYRIPRMIYTDVLSPVSICKLTVKTEDGQIVTSTDGVVLENVEAAREYNIVLNKIGLINICYYGDDSSDFEKKDNSKPLYQYNIHAIDISAPTIEVSDNYAKTAKVGDALIVPEYKVSDDYSPENKIFVIISVINPFGRETLISLRGNIPESADINALRKYGSENNSIIATYPGTYTFKISAFDEQFNQSMACVDIVVE